MPSGRRLDNRCALGVIVSTGPSDEVELDGRHCHAFVPLPEGR
jgi:hypothetical protein